MFTGARSRYLLSRIVKRSDGTIYFARREPIRYRADSRNRPHRVVRGDTLWSLAEEYFSSIAGAADLFWLIADYQDPPIIDPSLRLEPGALLIIPPEEVLLEYFSSTRRDVTDLF